MMKKTIFFLIILTIPFVFASVNNYNNNSAITIRTNITINSFLTYETDSADIDEVKLTTSFFPKNTKFQDVLDIKLTPKPFAGIKRTNNEIICKWDKPSTEMSFNINSLVKSKNDFIKIKDKINFPPPSFSNELKRYIQPS